MLITDVVNNMRTFVSSVADTNSLDFSRYVSGGFTIRLSYPDYSVNVDMDNNIENYTIGKRYTRHHNYMETWVFNTMADVI